MYNSFGQKPMGRVDDRRGALAEISADAPSFSLWISNKIQILDGGKIVVVGIQKTICGGINTENLIKSIFLSKN